MAIGWNKLALPKAKTRKQLKAKMKRLMRGDIANVRVMVFMRDRDRCRCCGRTGDSMHEIRPRSLGGKVSTKNSVCLCGSGTTGCHGFAQTKQIEIGVTDLGADGPLSFIPTSRAAAEWMQREVDTPKLSRVP